MTLEPIFIMASAVLVFVVGALTIGTVLGMALGQARIYFNQKSHS